MTNLLEQRLLSAKEAAKVLGVSTRTLWGITSPRGNLVCCRIGGRILYSQQSIARYIESLEKGTKDENENAGK